jgi:hypothetical protein
MDVENTIARATMDRVEFRDPRRRDNPTTVAELALSLRTSTSSCISAAQARPPFSRLNLLNPNTSATSAPRSPQCRLPRGRRT